MSNITSLLLFDHSTPTYWFWWTCCMPHRFHPHPILPPCLLIFQSPPLLPLSCFLLELWKIIYLNPKDQVALISTLSRSVSSLKKKGNPLAPNSYALNPLFGFQKNLHCSRCGLKVNHILRENFFYYWSFCEFVMILVFHIDRKSVV